MKIADVSRSDPFEPLVAELEVTFFAREFEGPLPLPHKLVLDLDLDVGATAASTTFFESFESGFGAFTTMHLDEQLNPPDSDLTNDDAGLAAADGYRCQC